MYDSDPALSAFLLDPDSGRRYPLPKGWLPLSWSPDGTSLLVADAGRLGLVRPPDLARVDEVGTFPVPVWQADWVDGRPRFNDRLANMKGGSGVWRRPGARTPPGTLLRLCGRGRAVALAAPTATVPAAHCSPSSLSSPSPVPRRRPRRSRERPCSFPIEAPWARGRPCPPKTCTASVGDGRSPPERLTAMPPGRNLSVLTAGSGQVIVSEASEGTDKIARLVGDRLERLIDDRIFTPSLSDGGRLAYVRLDEAVGRPNEHFVVVRDLASGEKRTVYRHTGVPQLSGVGTRLLARRGGEGWPDVPSTPDWTADTNTIQVGTVTYNSGTDVVIDSAADMSGGNKYLGSGWAGEFHLPRA